MRAHADEAADLLLGNGRVVLECQLVLTKSLDHLLHTGSSLHGDLCSLAIH